jgi:CAAX amino terminal protease family.
MEWKRPYPRAGEAVLLIVILFVIQFVGGILVYLSGAANEGIKGALYLVFIVSLISVIVPSAIGLLNNNVSLKDYFSWRKISPALFVLILILTAGIHFCLQGMTNAVVNTLPIRTTDAVSASGLTSPAGILFLVVVGPIFEEMLFRGIMLRGFLNNYSILKALLISSLLFGIAHFNIIQLFTTGCLGIVLALVFVKTGSLWYSILAHSFNNLLAVISLMRVGIGILAIKPLCLIAGGLAAAGLSLLALLSFQNKLSGILVERDYTGREAPSLYEDSYGFKKAAHPVVGIISFSMSILSAFCMLLCLIPAVPAVKSRFPGVFTSLQPQIIAALITSLIGLVLGITGAAKKGSKKVFSVLGIIINSLVILCFLGLIVIGIFIIMILQNAKFTM